MEESNDKQLKALLKLLVKKYPLALFVSSLGIALTITSKFIPPGVFLGLGLIVISIGVFLVTEKEAVIVLTDSTTKVRLLWKNQLQFVGFYAAKQVGCPLELKEGGTPVGIDPIAAVVDGIDEFAITTCIDLIRSWHSRADVKEKKVLPCLVIFRTSPVCVISKQEREVSSNQLNGARVAFFGRADSTYREFMALTKMAGLQNISAVFLEDEKFLDPLSVLIEGKADFRIGYAFNEGLVAARKPDYRWDYLSNVFGQIIYSDVLCTTSYYLQNNRKVVEQLIKAVLDGYNYHTNPDNESETWSLLKEYCQSQYQRFEERLAEDWNPLTSAQRMLRECIEEDAQQTYNQYLGNLEMWERMEQMLVFDIKARDSYTQFMKSEGLFELK